jgi:cell division protease FtsH
MSLPERDQYTRTKEQMLAEIQTALGGRAADELVFKQLTTGASHDFQQATDVARKMVCVYGMSDLGMATYGQSYYDFKYSEKTRELIDQEVQKILDTAYEQTKKMLTDHRQDLDKLALTLLERETMFAGEVYELLGITPRADHRLTQKVEEPTTEQT